MSWTIAPRLNELHLRDLHAKVALARRIARDGPARPAAPTRVAAASRARFVLASDRCALGSLAAVAVGPNTN